jgi:hypothetical protein
VGEQILPVFISIDPECDTVQWIQEYLIGNLEYQAPILGLYSLTCTCGGQPQDVVHIENKPRVMLIVTAIHDDDDDDVILCN